LDNKKLIYELNKDLLEALEDFEDRAKQPLNREVSIKNPDNNSGIHFRDDGVVELYAGDTRLIMDGNSGIILIDAEHIINHATDNNHLNKNNGWGINGSPINSSFYNYSSSSDKSVVMTVDDGSLNQDFITGIPGEGQYLLKLSTLFKRKQLFLPPKETSENLLKILKGI
jgi:hypothetical protein